MRTIGPYAILSELARGGMGVVFRAKGPQGLCALKVLLAADLDPRFEEEVHVAQRLTHPAIVRTLDAGLTPDGQRYLVMELVEGQDLDQRLKNQGPLPVDEALDLAIELAEALDHAHALGVIHRDVKPSNVLQTRDGAVKLADFGLGKRLDRATRMTATGEILGTPNYMPPEQVASTPGTIGPEADVYALGATLYALLTGQPPFRGRQLVNVLHAVLNRTPDAPSTLRPGLDPRVDALCLRCLAKDPAERYPSARALRDALLALRQQPPPRVAKTGAAVVLALASLVALLAVGLAISRPRQQPAAATPSAAVASSTEVDPLTEASRLLERGRYVAARDLLEPLRAAQPDDTAVLARWCLAEYGSWLAQGPLPATPDARSSLRTRALRVLEADPGDRYALRVLGELDTPSGETYARRLAALAPAWGHTVLLTARLNANLGDWPLSLDQARSLLAQTPALAAEAKLVLSNAMLQIRRYASARALLDGEGEQALPYSCLLQRAQLEAAQGDLDAARSNSLAALELSGGRCTLSLALLCRLSAWQGDADTAIAYARRLVDMADPGDETCRATSFLVQHLRRAQRDDDARQVLREAAEAYPSVSAFARQLSALNEEPRLHGDSLLEEVAASWDAIQANRAAGAPDSLISACRRRLEERPHDANARLAQAWLLLCRNQQAESAELLRPLVAAESPPGLSHVLLALATWRHAPREVAPEGPRLLDAVLEDGRAQALVRARALELRATIPGGDMADRVRDLDRAIEVSPRRVSLYARRAFLHFAMGSAAMAIRDSRAAITIAPDDPVACELLADLAWVMGSPLAQAQAHLERGLTAAQDPRPLLLAQARHHMHATDYEAAHRELDAYQRRFPDDPHADELRAWVRLTELRQWGPTPPPPATLQATMACATRALEADPSLVGAWVARAALRLWFLPNPASSADDLDRARSLAPGHAGLLALDGFLARKRGDDQRARESYQAAVRIDPNLLDTQLGLALCVAHENPSLALWLTDDLVEQRPSQSLFWSRMMLRLEQQDAPGALLEIERGLRCGPSVAFLVERAQLFLAQGDLQAALRDAEAAVAEFPEAHLGYASRAAVRERMGNEEGARADRERSEQIKAQAASALESIR